MRYAAARSWLPAPWSETAWFAGSLAGSRCGGVWGWAFGACASSCVNCQGNACYDNYYVGSVKRSPTANGPGGSRHQLGASGPKQAALGNQLGAARSWSRCPFASVARHHSGATPNGLAMQFDTTAPAARGTGTMITADALTQIPLFAGLPHDERASLASRAADVRLQQDECLLQEGQSAAFFALLEG